MKCGQNKHCIQNMTRDLGQKFRNCQSKIHSYVQLSTYVTDTGIVCTIWHIKHLRTSNVTNTEELPLIYSTCVNVSIRGVGISSFSVRMKNDFNITCPFLTQYVFKDNTAL